MWVFEKSPNDTLKCIWVTTPLIAKKVGGCLGQEVPSRGILFRSHHTCVLSSTVMKMPPLRPSSLGAGPSSGSRWPPAGCVWYCTCGLWWPLFAVPPGSSRCEDAQVPLGSAGLRPTLEGHPLSMGIRDVSSSWCPVTSWRSLAVSPGLTTLSEAGRLSQSAPQADLPELKSLAKPIGQLVLYARSLNGS